MIRTSKHHGTFLVEMLFIIAMFGLVFVLEARLFSASMRVISSAPMEQQRQARLDRMADALRRDVWSANQITMPDAETVVLAQPDGAERRWTFRGDGRITRVTDGTEWTIAPVQKPVAAIHSFVLRSATTAEPDGDELRFFSQPLMAAGVKR